jgi:hypothetical protein
MTQLLATRRKPQVNFPNANGRYDRENIPPPPPLVERADRPIPLERIVYAACEVFNVNIADLKGSRRSDALVMCRRAIVVLAKRHGNNISYPQITREIRPHGTSHTTAKTTHGKYKPEQEMDINCETKTQAGWVEAVEKELGIKPRTQGGKQ